ncbi:Chymotrypsin-like elastase member 3B [Desmophyllum pertusum]|uniref:Chymotrypsin-like elastase member 3B n=1 Tax=Desmophyllum pertusum TaxID=174260 RepID=A0A9X0DC05_9CNID|nr:Chymotrypsin-like elastase member 3B [Desmophyllum pertusum]
MKSMIVLLLAFAVSRGDAIDGDCDFEKDLCNWSQAKNDKFDWTRRSGRTPSSFTGPSSAKKGSYYIYIETSIPRRPGDKAVLTLQGANSKSVCLTFYYHMYGSTIRTLSVSNKRKVLWSMTGKQGNSWKKAEVSISGAYDLKIEGVRGTSFTGDIAIDDLSVADGSCGGVTANDVDCDFESDLCKWNQDKGDAFDWTRRSGGTPSSFTGPSSAKKGSYYIYIETSSPRRPGDKAVLTLQGANSKSVCLTFYYHMYGSTIGTLSVSNKGKALWSMTGNQGNSWKKAEVSISGAYDLKIEGVRGTSFTGDIAIDDLSVTNGPCGGVPPTTLPPTVPPGPSSCGVSPMTRVIGGVDAVPGSWPWQVGIYLGNQFFCGGSLIARSWVVTAAHCTFVNSGKNYTIRLGDHNRNLNEGTEQSIPAIRVIRHPNYNTPPISNDIALIQLSRPATLNSRVGTVCLPSHDEVVPTSARCFITGWGKIQHPGPAHPILQQANMSPVTNNECARKLAASPGGSSLQITPQMICAGINGTNLSGCHGDSGGPYVCQNSSGNWVLQGAVSWGSPICSAAERYSVFSRVAKFINWINQYV